MSRQTCIIYIVMDFYRINYDAGVMFVFRGKNNSQLYTIGIHPKGTFLDCCSGPSYPDSRHGCHVSRLQASAQRKDDAGLLLGYYTPDGSVHTFDDGDEDAMFDRLARIREYMLAAVERDVSTFREIDEPVKEYEPPTEKPSVMYHYPKYGFEP
jgi:hypothetical protein